MITFENAEIDTAIDALLEMEAEMLKRRNAVRDAITALSLARGHGGEVRECDRPLIMAAVMQNRQNPHYLRLLQKIEKREVLT